MAALMSYAEARVMNSNYYHFEVQDSGSKGNKWTKNGSAEESMAALIECKCSLTLDMSHNVDCQVKLVIMATGQRIVTQSA